MSDAFSFYAASDVANGIRARASVGGETLSSPTTAPSPDGFSYATFISHAHFLIPRTRAEYASRTPARARRRRVALARANATFGVRNTTFEIVY